DALIVLHCIILRIDVFRVHIGFIILQVSTIMEVPLSRSQIGPCLKCEPGHGAMSGTNFKKNQISKTP
ncbi:hypothetical protein K443DRAFT_102281, partial [Laccaria amethystina LaAM-08-1]